MRPHLIALTLATLPGLGWAEPFGLWIGQDAGSDPTGPMSFRLYVEVKPHLVKKFSNEWDCLVARKVMQEPHKYVECHPVRTYRYFYKQRCTPETCGVYLTPKPSTGRQ